MNINDLIPVRDEMSEAGRDKMREKFRQRNPKDAAFAHLSDEAIANHVYMLNRNDLDIVSIVQAARDRIMHLSLQVEKLKKDLKTAEDVAEYAGKFM